MLLGEALHKRLLADHPADSTRAEESQTIIFRELLRTVVGTIVLYEVLVGISISGTEYPVLTIVRNLTTRTILLAAEESHGGDIVLTELAGPVQLQLIVQVALGSPVVHVTTLCAPLVTHGVVETVVTLVRLLVVHGASLGVDPFQLRVVIQVGNTAAVLTEHVVP